MTREEQAEKYASKYNTGMTVWTSEAQLKRWAKTDFLAGWDARDGGIKNCCSDPLQRIKELEDALEDAKCGIGALLSVVSEIQSGYTSQQGGWEHSVSLAKGSYENAYKTLAKSESGRKILMINEKGEKLY